MAIKRKAGLKAVAGLLALSLGLTYGPAQADTPDRRQALFGDVHVHSRYSFDAYIFGVRATPDDAYRYARGETIRHASGYDIKLKGGPLDFYAVIDHAEYMGVLPAMDDEHHPLSDIPYAQDMFSTVQAKIVNALTRVRVT